MTDTIKYNGIDMADIASINGQTLPAGGGGGVSESNTGILYFEGGGFNSRMPDAQELFSDSAVSLYKAQLSTRTDIVDMKDGQYHTFFLSSSGDLYSSGYTNTGYIGRALSPTPAEEIGLSLTSVSKFAPHDNGCWAIKTDGTLWWCGSISQYANSSDTGQGSNYSGANQWKQFGTDTDWIDIDCFVAFPTVSLAIKGAAGSEYLYSSGSNYFGKTGVGTTSGSTRPWTRVKSAASTDWAETIDKISAGYGASMAVTKSGKLFAWGDAQEGHLGQGNTTDSSYPIQVGTDTDWSKPIAKARNAGYCIKTDGTVQGSRRSTSFYQLSPATSNRTYSQCGTDTDYEDIIAHATTSGTGKLFLFAKKNGVWYANWGYGIVAGSFMGNTAYRASPADNTWVSINDMLDGNDITVGVSMVKIGYKEGNQQLGEVVTIATTAT